MSRVSIALAVALLAACSAPRESGYLGSYYAMMKPHPEHKNTRLWVKEGIDLRPYDELIISKVVIWLHPESKAATLGDETLQKVSDAFTRILTETISPYYDIVTEPAPNVLKVQIAVTDVMPAPEAPGSPMVGVGEAAMEGKLIDSTTDEVLAVFEDRITGSAAGSGKVPREWRHVEGAFIEWANRLLDYIDSHHAGADEG